MDVRDQPAGSHDSNPQFPHAFPVLSMSFD
jgi:hypothetical protein